MTVKPQSYAFDGLVMLHLVDDNMSSMASMSAELSPNEARLLALKLIRNADSAEHVTTKQEDM